MKVHYYPGCSLEATARPYDRSTRRVCECLRVQLQEIPDWQCCGASPALKMNRLLSSSLACHTLSLVPGEDSAELVAPCPFCFRRLKSAQEEVHGDPVFRGKVETVIEAKAPENVTVHNLLGFLRYRVGLEAISVSVRRPLQGLKVIPYYGCYVVKPPSVTQYDDPENPVSLDQLLQAAGAEVLDWDFKTDCCGAGLSLSKTDTVCELSGRLIREAVWRGADVIAVVCQLCQANLDMRQTEIGRLHGRTYAIPIVYFTQLLGLAFGFCQKDMELHHHLVDPMSVLTQKGFA